MFTGAKCRREKTYVIAMRTLQATARQSRGFRPAEKVQEQREDISFISLNELRTRFVKTELQLLINSRKIRSFTSTLLNE